ncbi:hypothetical protein AB8878_07040 [Alphaproteobacteria bacterium LSUCC0226]|jgi:hypothetical protein
MIRLTNVPRLDQSFKQADLGKGDLLSVIVSIADHCLAFGHHCCI